MGKKLIIVESPTKIKTLKKFLGPDYIFESSLGHIRDLPVKGFGIDVENDFEPEYVTMPEKRDVIEKLKKAAKLCDTVYLSPDPDREGEAIAWHIASILPKNTNIKRASFNAITKESVLNALAHPTQIDTALVNAQQARRLLDRIVGYKISPLLNRRVQRGKGASGGFVSAGRVQSVALKLVVDREKEIEAFKPVEYWNITALLKTGKEERAFTAYLHSVDGRRVEKEAVDGKDYYLISSKDKAEHLLQKLHGATYTVTRVEKKEKKRNPVPPFITSTLQQEASRHHGFSSSRTMKIAQELYEGIDMGEEGEEGLITYMRTDSVRLSPEALQEARSYILERFGKEYLPEDAKVYASKKSAQDAHEAIRPTNLNHPPEKIRKFLTKDQFHLYDLIWKRFIASQMMPAVYDTVSADVETDKDMLFRATGSTMKFAGFLAVYEEKEDEDSKDEENKTLPPLVDNQKLHLQDILSEQSFTKPPPRFSEASLIKELEKLGIGRPSTYTAIMNKIQSRDYTVKENQRLKPTDLGRVIAEMLEANFQQVMNIGFTAEMENDLERVADKEKDWKALIRDFWAVFIPTIELAEKEAFVPKVMTDIDCPKCGSKLQKIWAHSKYFYGCSRYPDCDYSATAEELTFNKQDYAEDFNWEQPCPVCTSPMKLRHGRYGAFLGCTRYPECKGIVNIPKKGEALIAESDLPKCPAIGCPGHIVARKSRFGKIFFSCSTFPECDVIANSLELLESKYQNYERTPYVKKEKKGFAKKTKTASKASITKSSATKSKATKTGVKKVAKKSDVEKPKKVRVMPSLALSADLAKIVGSSEMPRQEVLKKLWEYIKKHNLQDSSNKRQINPDKALSGLFSSSEPIDMFKLPGLISSHMKKIE
ncbi:MAG: type I DNA topoisomerase [Chlamydiales bacterium]|nr:type I DNA topoisomerase [Chlamydiales bacterium]